MSSVLLSLSWQAFRATGDRQYFDRAARRGWLAVISYLNEDGDVREVCEGTGKKNDLQYYLDRKRNVGDLHGQAPILWCAAALLR